VGGRPKKVESITRREALLLLVAQSIIVAVPAPQMHVPRNDSQHDQIKPILRNPISLSSLPSASLVKLRVEDWPPPAEEGSNFSHPRPFRQQSWK
jgi:hypothetical protein